MKRSILSLALTLSFLLITFVSIAQEILPRRAFIGLDMETLSLDRKEALGLAQDIYGIYVKGVYEGSPAEKGGIRTGDVIDFMNETKINEPKDLLFAIKEIKNNATVTFSIYRNLKKKKVKVNLIPFPKEESALFSTIYSAAISGGNIHRVIITKPKAQGKYPAVIMLQGVGCFSQDNMSYPAIRNIVDSLTMAGYVVMRVEKSGIGDSRGKPCNEINFEEELGGYISGLKLLKEQPYVDPQNVFALGFSMGGIIAPVLHLQNKLKGIIAFGTIGKNWFEYELENTRRQFILANESLDSLDSFMRKEYNRVYGLFVAMATPTDIINKYPWTKDNLFIYPMSFAFFQQVAMIDISTLWMNTNTNVLAIHGSSDFVSSANEHQMISDYVNIKNPGMGTYLELKNTDHFLNTASSPKASLNGPPGKFNPEIIQVIKSWIEEKSTP